MLNIVIYQGNANKSHNEALRYSFQNDYYQKELKWSEDVEKMEPPTLLVGMQIGVATVENSMGVSKKITNKKIEISYNPVTLLLDIYLKETLIQKVTCTLLIEALFIISKIWKQVKCPPTNEWKKKMWYVSEVIDRL